MEHKTTISILLLVVLAIFILGASESSSLYSRFYEKTGHSYQFNPIQHFIDGNGTNIDLTADNQNNFDTVFSNSADGAATQNFALFQSISNNTSGINFFQFRIASGHYFANQTAQIYPCQKDQIIARVVATSWTGSGWGGTRTGWDMVCTENWNSSNRGSEIRFFVSPNATSGSVNYSLILDASGQIRMSSMIGSGDRSICTHADGTLFSC